MRHGDALHLVRIHVESGHEDHVLLSIFYVNEAPLVDATDVAGAKQVASYHDLCGLVGPLPIAGHHLRATHANLSDFVEAELSSLVIANADFRRRNRQSDGSVEIRLG